MLLIKHQHLLVVDELFSLTNAFNSRKRHRLNQWDVRKPEGQRHREGTFRNANQ